MTVYINDENFDASGSLPAAWLSFGSGVSVDTGSHGHSAPNSLKFADSGDYSWAYKSSAVDTNSGQTRVEGWLTIAGSVTSYTDPGLYLRTQAAPTSQTPPAGYALLLGMYSGDVGLRFQKSGTDLTAWPNWSPSLLSTGIAYRVIFQAEDAPGRSGCLLTCWIQRSTDSAWLTYGATWSTGAQTPCYSWGSGGGALGPGFSMVGAYTTSAVCYWDDVTFQDAIEPTIYSGSAPTDEVEWILGPGTVTSSDAWVSSHGIALVYDGDFTTSFSSTGVSGGFAGIDLGSGHSGILSRVLYSPRVDARTDSFPPGEESVLQAIVESSATSGGTYDLLGRIPAPGYVGGPFPRRYATNALPIDFTGGSAYQFHRLRNQFYYLDIAELAFCGNRASGVSWKPARPTITPGAGRFAAGETISISTLTSGGQLLYATDGTTPAGTYSGSTLTPSGTATLIASNSGTYTLPAITSGTSLTLTVVACHQSGATQFSTPVVAIFNPAEFVPDTGITRFGTSNTWPQDWYDDLGYLLASSAGDVILDGATSLYYMVGDYLDSPTVSGDVATRGFSIYSGSDLLNWHQAGYVPAAPNTFLDTASPFGYLQSQTRPHFFANPSPIDPNNKYLLVCHLDNSGFNNGFAGFATAPTMLGPWTWKNYAQPTGAIIKDCSLFTDSDGSLWLIAANASQAEILAHQLDPATDYTSFDGTNLTLDTTGDREAPRVVGPVAGFYYLFTSHVTPYGSGATDEKYKSASGASLSAVAAGLVAAGSGSIYASSPATTSVAYNAQSASFFPVVAAHGFVYWADVQDPDESPLSLDHARMAWWPVPPSSFSSGAFSIAAPNAWNLSSLPPSSDPAAIAATLSGASASIATRMAAPASIAATIPRVAASIAATVADRASVAATLPGVTADLLGAARNAAVVAATPGRVSASVLAGSGSDPAAIAATIPAVRASVLSATNAATIAATLPRISAALVVGHVSSSISTLVVGGLGSRLIFTGGLGGVSLIVVLPNDLAAAIAQAIMASSAIADLASQGPFNSEASDGVSVANGPYIVFKITSDPIEFASSSSQWGNTRIGFECLAPNALAANNLAGAVLATFGTGQTGVPGVSLAFETGVTTPFLMVDRKQASAPRGKGNTRVFKSCVDYSARTRVGLPS